MIETDSKYSGQFSRRVPDMRFDRPYFGVV